MTLSWNAFLVKVQFTLLWSFLSNWTYLRRKLCQLVIFHVNCCIFQCACIKIYTLMKMFQLRHMCLSWQHMCLSWNIFNTLFYVLNLKHFTNTFYILFTSTKSYVVPLFNDVFNMLALTFNNIFTQFEFSFGLLCS